jgi:hypothetical protein
MLIEGVQCTTGQPLILDELVELVGYQIEHVVTGRLSNRTCCNW